MSDRAEWDDRPVSTVSPAPALLVVPCPLLVTAELPAHGTVRTPLTVHYTVTNRSSTVYSLVMLMDPSEGFIFAGNKRVCAWVGVSCEMLLLWCSEQRVLLVLACAGWS